MSNNTITLSTWWLGLCKHTQLSKMASRILDFPSTSAACERSFSFQGRLQSKKRNRLFQKHVEKLAFVHQNLKLSDSTEVESRSQGSRPRPRPRTQKKSEGQGQGQGQPFRGQNLLEAKDRNARGQGQGPRTQPQVFSKKKVFKKVFLTISNLKA